MLICIDADLKCVTIARIMSKNISMKFGSCAVAFGINFALLTSS